MQKPPSITLKRPFLFVDLWARDLELEGMEAQNCN